jgi:hypothetical protein
MRELAALPLAAAALLEVLADCLGLQARADVVGVYAIPAEFARSSHKVLAYGSPAAVDKAAYRRSVLSGECSAYVHQAAS